MKSYKLYKKEQFEKNKKLKEEYDNLEDEYYFIQQLVTARHKAGLSQKQLADVTGIAQSEISKYESGKGNPSLKTINKLAKGMNRKIIIEFV